MPMLLWLLLLHTLVGYKTFIIRNDTFFSPHRSIVDLVFFYGLPHFILFLHFFLPIETVFIDTKVFFHRARVFDFVDAVVVDFC